MPYPFAAKPSETSKPALPLAMRNSTPPATTAPRTWATMYGASFCAGNRPLAHNPMETAGLRWQPEMCPMANAIVSTVRPKARDTPSSPMPTPGNAADRTALPHPPRTNQNVPTNSAEYTRMTLLTWTGRFSRMRSALVRCVHDDVGCGRPDKLRLIPDAAALLIRDPARHHGCAARGKSVDSRADG